MGGEPRAVVVRPSNMCGHLRSPAPRSQTTATLQNCSPPIETARARPTSPHRPSTPIVAFEDLKICEHTAMLRPSVTGFSCTALALVTAWPLGFALLAALQRCLRFGSTR
eukprot:3155395-Prymnesium_polylepis.1